MQGDFVIKIKKINLFYFLIGRLLQSEWMCWGLPSREGKGVETPIFPPSLTVSTFSVPKGKSSPLSWCRQVWHFLNGTSMGLCREQRKSPEPKHLVSTWKTDLVLLMYGSPAAGNELLSVSSLLLVCSVQGHSYSPNIMWPGRAKNSECYQLTIHVGKDRLSFCSLLWELLNNFIHHLIKCISSFSTIPSPARTYTESKYKRVCFAGRQKGVFELGMSCNIWLLVFHKEVDKAAFCLRASIKFLRWCWTLTTVKLQ